MPESKHYLKSKIFMTALVGLIASITTSILKHYGYDVYIDYETKSNIATVLLCLIAVWRPMKTVPVHFRKPVNTANKMSVDITSSIKAPVRTVKFTGKVSD